MTKKSLDPRHKGIHNVAFATILVMVGLTLSKGTGFLREILVPQKFGYGDLTDAFYLGFQIPDLFYNLLVGGAISSAITPTLSRSIEQGKEKYGWKSISIFISFITLAMAFLVIVGELFAQPIFSFFYIDLAKILNPNASESVLNPEKITLAVNVSKVLLPQVFLMMLASLCIGILNAYKKFSSTAFGPTLYNILVVLSILFLGGMEPKYVVRVSVGILVSAGVYFLLQFFLVRHEVIHFHFLLNWKDSGFQRLFRLAIPTMLSASVMQLNTIIIAWFAGFFPEGTLTSLRQATTIWQLPYGIFAVAVGSVMLPTLARNYAGKEFPKARGLLARSLRNSLFLTIPSAAILAVMSKDVVMAIFSWRGSYNEQAIETTAIMLLGYSLAVIMYTMIFIYNQAFYAIGRTQVPLFNGIITLILSVFFCWLYIQLKVGPASLSLAYSTTSIISVLILSKIYHLNSRLAPKKLWPFLIRAGISTMVLVLITLTLNQFPFYPQSKVVQLIWLMIRIGAGLGGYLLTAKVFQMRELNSFLERFNRFKRAKS